MLRPSTESIRTQYLEISEQTEQSDILHENFPVDIDILRKGCQIRFKQALLKCRIVTCSRMPYERRHIIIHRASSSALEIYEIRLPVAYHDIPGLKISIEKGRHICLETARNRKGACCKIFSKPLEVFLKQNFMKLYPSCLEETIFEIVQIKHC